MIRKSRSHVPEFEQMMGGVAPGNSSEWPPSIPISDETLDAEFADMRFMLDEHLTEFVNKYESLWHSPTLSKLPLGYNDSRALGTSLMYPNAGENHDNLSVNGFDFDLETGLPLAPSPVQPERKGTGTRRPGGRALATHLDPKIAKAAHEMRKTVACWHCVLQRDRVSFWSFLVLEVAWLFGLTYSRTVLMRHVTDA